MIRTLLMTGSVRRTYQLIAACLRLPIFPCAALCCAVFLGTQAPTACGQGTPIMRIEEDWYIKSRTPVPNHQGPQVTTVISPQADLSGHYAVFAINYSDLPTFNTGGLQLQIWNQNSNVVYLNEVNTSVMGTTDEIIRYTTKMSIIAGGNLEFEVKTGRSTTWGSFGLAGSLKASVPTQLTDLSGYSPTTTLALSGISRSAHNMDQISISAVRYYSATGTIITNDRMLKPVFVHTDDTRFLTWSEYLASPYLLDRLSPINP
ncbi:MAG TPA: hypothetical protein PLR25_15535 [Planctomycetaceae bacterium]|nr:hypothetical protein [Planctomycetaceae bacterium]